MPDPEWWNDEEYLESLEGASIGLKGHAASLVTDPEARERLQRRWGIPTDAEGSTAACTAPRSHSDPVPRRIRGDTMSNDREKAYLHGQIEALDRYLIEYPEDLWVTERRASYLRKLQHIVELDKLIEERNS
jgi:hypothetical protein